MTNCKPFRYGYKCKCEKCGQLFEASFPVGRCLECRRIFKSTGQYFVKCDVDGTVYNVETKLYTITPQQPKYNFMKLPKYRVFSNFLRSSKKWIARKMEISEQELEKLYKTAIQKGIYDTDEYGSTTITISFARSGYLNNQQQKGEWIPVTKSRVDSFIRQLQRELLERGIA